MGCETLKLPLQKGGGECIIMTCFEYNYDIELKKGAYDGQEYGREEGCRAG